MTLQELKYVVALSKYKHFRKAAEYCCVSQPTLSVAIKKIEEQLGISLFERSNAEIHITLAGSAIIAKAQAILLQVDELKDLAKQYNDPLSGILRLGFIHTVGSYLYPSILKEFRKHAPDMPVHLYEGYTKTIKEKLNEGALDIAIVALPFAGANIVTRELYSESFELLLPVDHPLASKTTIAPSDLSSETLFTLGEGHCFGDQVKQLCPDCFVSDKANLQYEGTSLEAVRHMVYSGAGITILPKSAAYIPKYLQSSLVTRPIIGERAVRKIALAWRLSYPRTAVIDVLLKAIAASDIVKKIAYN